MQQKKKQTRPNSDRSGDRFIHDLMSSAIAGSENMRKDACVDVGSKTFGSSHRSQYPHRSVSEMVTYMCLTDIAQGRVPNPVLNGKLALGHVIVDKLPSKLKDKMKLVQQVRGIFG